MHYIHSRLYGIYVQSGPQINNTALPMATYPKVMGLTVDPNLTYGTHIHTILVHAQNPLQIIKNTHRNRMGQTERWLPIRLWSMPLPYGHLWHPRPALTKCKSCRTQR